LNSSKEILFAVMFRELESSSRLRIGHAAMHRTLPWHSSK